METFYFLIPNGVIAEMGLSNDGQTVSREVRLGDLVAGGQMGMNEYHDLSKAGMVFVSMPLFTFHAIEQTAEGWVCTHLEPEPLAWVHTRAYLKRLFPGGTVWGEAVKLPYYVRDGGLYVIYFSHNRRASRFHPDAEALTRAGWAGAVAVDLMEYDDGESYSDLFVED